MRRSPERQSWWPRRWRSWTSRRPPPSRCSPMCLTWMMTSGGRLCLEFPPLPRTRVTWRPLKTIRGYSGQTKSLYALFLSVHSLILLGQHFYFLIYICLDGHNIATINNIPGPMSMYGKTSGDIYCQFGIYTSNQIQIQFIHISAKCVCNSYAIMQARYPSELLLTLFMFRSMGNLSNSSSDQSGHRTQGPGDLGLGGQYSPIHRELGAILKAETRASRYSLSWSQ